jgi:hypothetical protein
MTKPSGEEAQRINVTYVPERIHPSAVDDLVLVLPVEAPEADDVPQTHPLGDLCQAGGARGGGGDLCRVLHARPLLLVAVAVVGPADDWVHDGGHVNQDGQGGNHIHPEVERFGVVRVGQAGEARLQGEEDLRWNDEVQYRDPLTGTRAAAAQVRPAS